MMDDPELVEQIVRAQAFEVRGDHEAARAVYSDLWEHARQAGDEYRACVFAHFLAHTHSEPTAQLEWHRRSLASAAVAAGEGDERVRAFYPSLHANLGDVYLRLGERELARAHVEQARMAAYVLGDDAYGQTVRTLIDRLSHDLADDAPTVE